MRKVKNMLLYMQAKVYLKQNKTIELEYLAIIWTIECFHYSRWVLRLQPYNFKIIHRPGRVYNNAIRIEYVKCNFLGMKTRKTKELIIEMDTESKTTEQSEPWETNEE